MRYDEPTWMTEKRRKRVAVLAGPDGYYGDAFGIVIGLRQESVEMARDDANTAADWIEASNFAAPHAWRLVN